MWKLLETTSFLYFTWGNAIMDTYRYCVYIPCDCKEYEPLLLLPIGLGIIIGNIPVSDKRLSVYIPKAL